MTKEQSKAHWWIVENHPDFRIEPPEKYFEICNIVFDALKQGQTLPIDSVVGQSEQLPQDKFCKVCNLPTDGEKCYSKRCPV